MKQYLISYKTVAGLIVLNAVIDANSREEAIAQVVQEDNALFIINIIAVKPQK